MSDLPGWITAVATVAALIFAGTAAWMTWRALQLERSKRVSELEAERRSLAEAVTAWVDGEANSAATCHIENSSAQAIYQVDIEYQAENWDGNDWVRVIPPGLTDRIVHESEGHPEGFDVAVTFNDARGQRWHRDFKGALHDMGAADWDWVDDGK